MSEEGNSLDVISSGALVFSVGKSVSTLANFALQLLITRTLGAASFGVFSYGKTIVSIVGVFARVGTTESVMKFVPEYEDDERKQGRFIGTGAVTSIVGSLVGAAVIFSLAEPINEFTLGNPLFADFLRIFAVFLPLQVLTQVVANIFRAYEDAVFQIGIRDVLVPCLNLLSVAVVLALGGTVVGVGAAITFAAGIAVVVGFSLFVREFSIPIGFLTDRSDIARYYEFSIPLTLTSAGTLLYTQVDRLMVGYFLGDVEVGIYAIAISIATVLGLPLTGLNQLFPPVASKLQARSDRSELQTTFSTVTRWSFSLSLLPAIGIFVFRAEILAIFGPEFVAGTTVLSLFTLAQLTRNAVGPSGYMLMMTDHQYIVMFNRWLLGVLNVVANYLLILEFGFAGAAIASASTLAFVNYLRLVELWYLERYQPYTTAYLKPLAAGAVTIAVLWLLRTFVLPSGLSIVVVAAVGGTVGSVSYFALLYAFGIESEDYQLYDRMTG